tara:strand:+ start:701 stop:901 length:201 start_codon:yes stop_codon:yes gene_type:complete
MDQQLEFDLEMEQTKEKDKMLPSEGRGGVLALKGCNIMCNVITLAVCVGFIALTIYIIIASNNKEE